MEDQPKMHWKTREKLEKLKNQENAISEQSTNEIPVRESSENSSEVGEGNSQSPVPATGSKTQATSIKAQKEGLSGATRAEIAKLVTESMAKMQAANAGDTQALEELASASDVEDPDDFLEKQAYYFSNQRLMFKNYRRNGREVKMPFGGDGFSFRLIDSRVEGPEKDKRERCVYALISQSKKEVAFIEGHPWYDKLFWKDMNEVTNTGPDEFMWQTTAWQRLDKMSDQTLIAEVKNLQLAGHNVKVYPDLTQTKKQMLPIMVARLKKERGEFQMEMVNRENELEGLRTRAIAYETV